MLRAQRILAVIFLALSVLVVFESRKLPYATSIGPGPGFMPFWLGIIFGVLSLFWLVSLFFKPPHISETLSFDKKNMLNMLVILILLALTQIFIDRLGFALCMLLFTFILLLKLGRPNWLLTVIICVAGSYGVFHVFTMLSVQLPRFNL